MSNKLTQGEVQELAEACKIRLSDEELGQLTQYLEDSLNDFDRLVAQDLAGLEPTAHPIRFLTNVVRDDEVVVSPPVEDTLKNASQSEDNYFKIPSILGGDE